MKNLFDNISTKNKEKILKNLEANTLHFKKNNKILSTFKNENFIGIIIEGWIQIIKIDYNGNRTIIEDLEENGVFGTMISSFSNQEYDIITKDDTKIIMLDYDRIININNNNTYYNQFLKNLLEIVINITNERNKRIEILTKKTIRNKLLEYFNVVTKNNHSKIIYLTSTLTDLSDYLAIDRCAMMRELKYLKEEGFIEIKNKKITLLY